MAHLARCPACNSELELPSDEGDAKESQVQCPACDEVFPLAEATQRAVLKAKIVPAPEDKQDIADEPNDSEDSPKFASATLASFLKEEDSPQVEDRGAAETTESDMAPQTLAEFQKSLDDLLRQSPSEKKEYDPTAATVDDLSDQGFNAGVSDEEPSPTEDRLRPTLDEPLSDIAATEDEADEELDSFDSMEEFAEDEVAKDTDATVDDVVSPTAFESTLQSSDALKDTVAASVDDAPAFDFEGKGDKTPDGPQSLRAAMGLTADETLEVEDDDQHRELASVGADPHDDHDPAEINLTTSAAPRGVVATRKKSSALKMVRTLIGVVGGGAVGIAAGYLFLLWIFHFQGKTEEPLALAQYYPDVVKPATFRDGAAEVPDMGENEPNAALATNDEPEHSGTNATSSEGVETANFETEMPALDNEAPEPMEPAPWELDDTTAVEVEAVEIDGAPDFTAAELQQLTARAQAAAEGLLAGTFDDPAARPVKGSSYAQIAKLADALTFGEGAGDVSWKQSARRVFPKLFATPQSQQEINLIASYWINSEKRGHGGIFFCGTPDAGRQQGTVAEYQFTLPGGNQMTVLTPQALTGDVTSAPLVAVVGSVVDDPALRIEGYTGDAKRAIWSRDLLPVAE